LVATQSFLSAKHKVIVCRLLSQFWQSKKLQLESNEKFKYLCYPFFQKCSKRLCSYSLEKHWNGLL
jgi:hypothetical protein